MKFSSISYLDYVKRYFFNWRFCAMRWQNSVELTRMELQFLALFGFLRTLGITTQISCAKAVGVFWFKKYARNCIHWKNEEWRCEGILRITTVTLPIRSVSINPNFTPNGNRPHDVFGPVRSKCCVMFECRLSGNCTPHCRQCGNGSNGPKAELRIWSSVSLVVAFEDISKIQ